MRIKQLDALRAVALLLVLGGHLTWSPVLVQVGWSGVDLFFVLSGFLVSGLLFREYKKTGSIRPMAFLGRRGFKIYPAYYALLAFSAAAYRLPWHSVWPDLFFLQSYRKGSWGHLWSLAVEEHFYILLAFSFYFLAKGGADCFRRVPAVCLTIAGACLAMRTGLYLSGAPYGHYTSITPSHLRLDSLAFGVLLAYYHEFHADAVGRLLAGSGKLLLYTVSAVLLLPAAFFQSNRPFMYTVGFSCLYLGYGGLMVGLLHQTRQPGRLMSGLAWVGRYSYTIYLCHLPVAFLVLRAGTRLDRNLTFFTYLGASIAAGVVLAEALERPMLRLRERLLPGIGAPIVPAAQTVLPVIEAQSHPAEVQLH